MKKIKTETLQQAQCDQRLGFRHAEFVEAFFYYLITLFVKRT